ncbi:type I restriction endonuclease subunit M [Achromobacter mucicolens]|uniref:type I restriction endonuclease subunit M n=1 Tax=Achromobacter mucicolens TaxID=1389922 RepID=UPI0024536CDB|nr:type I restriction endonuclease subunit M [Achromobacter mucicolens]WGJ91264.1 type I restriction endonuclease subunit M [Achromobacter mucicolens]
MTAGHNKAAAWPEETHRKPRLFRNGNIVATPGALELLRQLEVSALGYLFRHMNGDWGDLDAEDKQANQAALIYGSRIFSSYALPDGKSKLWIITEADRSVTTLLLPDEY